MKLAIMVDGGGSITIDAVFVDIDYVEPCDRCVLGNPECSSEELALQEGSLKEILHLAESIGLSGIPLPTTLYRVRLCDGREIYLLHHELLLLKGNYFILQKIAIDNLGQTFVTNIGDGAPDVPHARAASIRYDLFALKLLYYNNDINIDGSLTRGYGNGKYCNHVLADGQP